MIRIKSIRKKENEAVYSGICTELFTQRQQTKSMRKLLWCGIRPMCIIQGCLSLNNV